MGVNPPPGVAVQIDQYGVALDTEAAL